MKNIVVCLLLLCSHLFTEILACYSIHKHGPFDFIVRWKISKTRYYDGNSVDELLAMCPNGCASCPTFPQHSVYTSGPSSPAAPAPCTNDDIVVLRKVQELARGWKNVKDGSPMTVIVHSCMLVVILALIVLLIIKGHYRFRDLWFLPTDRQWELERDPTWGLPGKVWALLQMRVVKSEDADSKPTDRKYSSYTDNPTTLGDKFWYYKQALRDMYKTHKYYKRNRYFHKLAWQFLKLGRLIPETLRKHKVYRRRAGELADLNSNGSSADDPLENLPWEVDLADEVNMETLAIAKVLLQEEIDKETEAGHFVSGRLQQAHHHHHHHHHPQLNVPLTKEEIEHFAKSMALDPNADCVNVDGLMRRHPTSTKEPQKTQHHHHHHHQQTKHTAVTPATSTAGSSMTASKRARQ